MFCLLIIIGHDDGRWLFCGQLCDVAKLAIIQRKLSPNLTKHERNSFKILGYPIRKRNI
jgi:hypothetical protein